MCRFIFSEVTMKNKFKILSVFLISVLLLTFTLSLYVRETTPDTLRVIRGQSVKLDTGYIYTTVTADDAAVNADSTGETVYDSTLNLFGFIPIKNIETHIVEDKQLCLSGKAFGVKLYTEGVVVIGLENISTQGGQCCPGVSAGLSVGDSIVEIDGVELFTASQLSDIITDCDGDIMSLTVAKTDGTIAQSTLTPVFCEAEECYKAGIWVRDSIAGIGTMTYIDPDTNTFGGLGHGICDADTGRLLPFGSGEIVSVVVTGVTKGADGLPGELHGYFGSDTLGVLSANSSSGVFGIMKSHELASGTLYPVAMKQDIREGSAQILTTLPGKSEPQLCSVTVERINYNSDNPGKNMVIRITDDELIKATGGIVQGMSGSPIIQNGRVIGAITHVFVNDPERGYGIFIENMLAAA